jgi:hypothetical protein
MRETTMKKSTWAVATRGDGQLVERGEMFRAGCLARKVGQYRRERELLAAEEAARVLSTTVAGEVAFV